MQQRYTGSATPIVRRPDLLRLAKYVLREAKMALGGREERTPEHVRTSYEQLAVNFYEASERMRPFIVDGRLRSANGWAFRREIARRIIDQTGGRGRLLEVGAGDGINVWTIDQTQPHHRLHVTGFDFAANRVQLAATQAPQHDWCVGDARRIPFADDSFDITYTVHCLEQLPYYATAVLREMRRVGRAVLLFEPFYEHQNVVGKMHNRSRDYVRDLSSSVEAAGLRCLEFVRLGHGVVGNQCSMMLCEKP